MQADLHRYLEMHRDMYKGGPFGKFYDVLLKKGSWYETHGDWTGGFPQMKTKECFSNALNLALKKDMLYCEGVALSSDLGIPMNHAWCVDAGSEVVDPTWRPRSSIFYGVGLVFDPKKAFPSPNAML